MNNINLDKNNTNLFKLDLADERVEWRIRD